MKRGPLSNKELEVVYEKMESATADEIAEELNRSVEAVTRVIEEKKNLPAPAGDYLQHNKTATIMTPVASQRADEVKKPKRKLEQLDYVHTIRKRR